MQIPLSGAKSAGLWAEISPEDQIPVLAIADTRGWRIGSRYVQSIVPKADDPCDRKTLSLHVFILQPPPGLVVDHINADLFDNRRSNLRALPSRANKEHRVARLCHGVWRSAVLGKWVAEARVYGASGPRAAAGNNTFLGAFDTFDEAIAKRAAFMAGSWAPDWAIRKPTLL